MPSVCLTAAPQIKNKTKRILPRQCSGFTLVKKKQSGVVLFFFFFFQIEEFTSTCRQGTTPKETIPET